MEWFWIIPLGVGTSLTANLIYDVLKNHIECNPDYILKKYEICNRDYIFS